MNKLYIAFIVLLTMTGCVSVHLDKNTEEQKITNQSNPADTKKCQVFSLDKAISLPRINVTSFKEKNDIKGLTKAMAYRIKKYQLLTELAASEVANCKE